jgi:AmmeMemoRadiSam system protein B/AmmeMemoRadiSam system protein A
MPVDSSRDRDMRFSMGAKGARLHMRVVTSVRACCKYRPRGIAAAMVTAALLAWGCGRPAAEQRRNAGEHSSTVQHIRHAAVAGMFYPGDPEELRSFVRDALAAAEVPECPGRIVALIAPHAGYEFSGAVAAHAYKAIEGCKYDSVVIIGPSHRVPCAGAVLSDSDIWETPLGQVPVDRDLADALVKEAPDLFVRNDTPHASEHSVEIQLPFLQMALENLRIVPIVLHDFTRKTCEAVGKTMAKVLKDKNVLMVASTDLAHYPPTGQCREIDMKTIANIEKLALDDIYEWEEEATRRFSGLDVGCTLCGLGPVVATLWASRELGADKVVRLKFANSGQVNPATADHSVGYAAMAVCASKLPQGSQTLAGKGEPATKVGHSSEGGEGKMASNARGTADNLTDEQKKRLLVLAREAISRWVKEGREVEAPSGDPAFAERRAVFVTLKKGAMLRGCIGTLEPVAPLGEAVVDSAISAATRDPRFRPVTADELDALDIHISVLSPMRRVASPDEIILGKHGIVVRQGLRSGVFLPEVAVEQGWDLDTTLSVLCREKAGLPADAWKRGAELRVFTTQSFGEEEYGLGPHARR